MFLPPTFCADNTSKRVVLPAPLAPMIANRLPGSATPDTRELGKKVEINER